MTRTSSYFLSALAISALCIVVLPASVTAAVVPSDGLVIYGSGSTHVERSVSPRDFGSCLGDPGSVCGALASACTTSLGSGTCNTDTPALLISCAVTCLTAAIWCGLQAVMQLLCCLGKVSSDKCAQGFAIDSYTGDLDIDKFNGGDAYASLAGPSGELEIGFYSLTCVEITGNKDVCDSDVVQQIWHSIHQDDNDVSNVSIDQLKSYFQRLGTGNSAGYGQ